MRRRRQKNPLLMRIIGISILVHIIVLPILAHFGAFKKIQRQFVEVTAVRLPPPPLPPEKKEQTAKKQSKPKPTHIAQKAKRANTTTAHQRQAPIRAAANLPHIATAGSGSGAGFEAQQGTGKMGQVATAVNTAPTQPTVQATPPPPAQTKPAPTPPQVEKPKEVAIAKPAAPAPTPQPQPAPAPKQPVFTEAEPALPLADEPQPVIPDDLRSDALDKTCVAEVTVGPDGKPTDAKISQSSGNDELDRLALEAARQWKFKPATRDGEPVESVVRLHIEFQVS